MELRGTGQAGCPAFVSRLVNTRGSCETPEVCWTLGSWSDAVNLVRSERRVRQVADGQRRDGKGCALGEAVGAASPTTSPRLPRRIRPTFGPGIGGSTIVDRMSSCGRPLLGLRSGGGRPGVRPTRALRRDRLWGSGPGCRDRSGGRPVVRQPPGRQPPGRLGHRRPFLLGSGLRYVVAGAVQFFPPVRGPLPVDQGRALIAERARPFVSEEMRMATRVPASSSRSRSRSGLRWPQPAGGRWPGRGLTRRHGVRVHHPGARRPRRPVRYTPAPTRVAGHGAGVVMVPDLACGQLGQRDVMGAIPPATGRNGTHHLGSARSGRPRSGRRSGSAIRVGWPACSRGSATARTSRRPTGS